MTRYFCMEASHKLADDFIRCDRLGKLKIDGQNAKIVPFYHALYLSSAARCMIRANNVDVD